MFSQRGHISGKVFKDQSYLLRLCTEAIKYGASSTSDYFNSSSTVSLSLRNLKLKSFLNAIPGTMARLEQRGIESLRLS